MPLSNAHKTRHRLALSTLHSPRIVLYYPSNGLLSPSPASSHAPGIRGTSLLHNNHPLVHPPHSSPPLHHPEIPNKSSSPHHASTPPSCCSPPPHSLRSLCLRCLRFQSTYTPHKNKTTRRVLNTAMNTDTKLRVETSHPRARVRSSQRSFLRGHMSGWVMGERMEAAGRQPLDCGNPGTLDGRCYVETRKARSTGIPT